MSNQYHQKTMHQNIYQDGRYLEKHPTWHTEDSPWKAEQIKRMIETNKLQFKSVCEIGCGAGEILNQLYYALPKDITFSGYEISPQSFELCKPKERDRLKFYLQDLFEDNKIFDLMLCIDVFEHIEDYFGFLRKLRGKAEYKIFHIPLQLSVQMIVRKGPLLKSRKEAGHLHYFTKETALATLEDTGYKILQYFYTANAIELQNKSFKSSLLKLPRKILFSLNEDIAAKTLGRFSLMVLAK